MTLGRTTASFGAALVLFLCGACADDERADAGGAADAGAADGGGLCARGGGCEERVEVTSAQHVSGPIAYGELPPAGGLHSGCWGDFGVQEAPLPPERFVHNLEHGAVVFLHQCVEACGAERAELRRFVERRPWAIMTVYDALPTRFAAVAWGYRLMSDTLDLKAFAAFYDAHADRAPESVRSGAPEGCN